MPRKMVNLKKEKKVRKYLKPAKLSNSTTTSPKVAKSSKLNSKPPTKLSKPSAPLSKINKPLLLRVSKTKKTKCALHSAITAIFHTICTQS